MGEQYQLTTYLLLFQERFTWWMQAFHIFLFQRAKYGGVPTPSGSCSDQAELTWAQVGWFFSYNTIDISIMQI